MKKIHSNFPSAIFWVSGLVFFSFYSASASTLDQGLVAWYPFDGNASDVSGNGNHGTVYGASLSVDRFGRNNHAYLFNGSSDYIDLGNDPTLDFPNNIFTWSAWVNHDLSPGSHYFANILRKGHLGGNWIRFNQNTEKISYRVKGIGEMEGDTVLVRNNWYQILCAYDGSNLSVYIDGILDKTTQLTGTRESSLQDHLLVGKTADASNEFWTGRIDEIRVYDRVLNTSEIQNLFSLESLSPIADDDNDGFLNQQEVEAGTDPLSASSIPGLDYGLVGWYPFDGDASDLSVNRNHGLVFGAGLGTDRNGEADKTLLFNGSNSHVELPNSASASLVEEFSVSMWVKSFATGGEFLFLRVTPGLSESVKLGIDANGIIDFRTNHVPAENENALAPGEWGQIVTVYDGSTQKIFLSGEKVHESNKTGNLEPTTSPLFIGVDKDSTFNQYFNGEIDEVRIYNRALSDLEVKKLYTLENTSIPLDGIQLWLDGKDLNGDGNLSNELVAGSKLPAWIDKSGNNRNAEQNATVDQPIVSSGGGLLFDGIYDHLTLGSNYIFSDQDGMTILAVANATTNKGTSTLYSFGATGGQTITLYYSSSQFAGVSSSEHGGRHTTFPVNIGSGRSLMVFKLKFNDRQLIRLNGQTKAEEIISLSALNASTISAYPERGNNGGPVTIGGQSKLPYETDRFYQGSIEEILVYDRALTKAELSQSEQYLAQKWGVTLLQEEPFDPGAGLVTHWKLDGSDAGVERVGVSTGLDRHMNPAGATFFPGNARVIQHPYNNFPSDAFTISYWERATSPRAQMRLSYATAESENTIVTTNWRFYLMNGGESGFSIHPPPANPYIWRHATISWEKSSGQTNVYWNGNLETTGTFRQNLLINSTGALCLGQDQDGVDANATASSFDQGFVGFLDDFRLYDRVLSPTEVENLYDLEKPQGGQEMKALVRGASRFGEIGLNRDIIQKNLKIITEDTRAVTSGIYHTLVLNEDGSLWTTGRNHAGELGDGKILSRSNLEMIVPSGVKQIAACGYHSLFVKKDGSLWGFGYNAHGELGLGDKSKRLTPTRILTDGVEQVISGVYHSLILKTDGSLWGMGDNRDGQLGNNLKSYYLEPIQINVGEVISAAGGYYHSAFVKSDGSLWTMGKNNYGQLGDATTTDRSVPVQIETSGVLEVSAGTYHTFYRKTDGSLWTVGYNGRGQLGDGTTTNRSTPIQIDASGVVSLADSSYSYATRYVKSDGSAWAVGDNQYGQLGDGTTIDRNQSVQVVASGIKSISSGHRFGFILTESGTLKGSGNRTYGRLGDFFPLANYWTEVEFAAGIQNFDLGIHLSSVVDGNGQVSGIGFNHYGQLGDGTTNTTGKWVTLPDTNASQVATSHYHQLYLDVNGSLWGVGYGYSGQLGIGNNNDQVIPVMIEPSGVKEISAAYLHSSYIKEDGSLWVMGRNNEGQLGTGSTNNVNSPVQIESSGVVSVKTHNYATYYLKSNGSMWGMGETYHGNLGIGRSGGNYASFNSNVDSMVPVEIVPSGVVAITAGPYNAMFIKEDGSLWGMGHGNNGKLGTVDDYQVNQPVLIEGSGVVTAAVGSDASFFIKNDGSLWVSGEHEFAELGFQKNGFEKVLKGPILKVDAESRSSMLMVPANLPPQKMELVGGKIFENSNIGAVLGHLVADDFDQDSNFTYSLVSGAGATHNDLFSIDANGSIIAQQSLDREVNATLSIRAQVMDEGNRTLEKTFLIEVLDDPAEDLISPTPEQGLVAHWRFDEKNGSVAYDSSGNGYHAHLRGAGDEAWVRHGKVNGAIALDRINDYLAIQGLYYSTTGEIQEITVSCWIKTTQANTEGVILSFDRSEFFRLSTGNLDINQWNRPYFSAYSNNSNLSSIGSAGSLATGDWVYLSASRNAASGENKIYLNGQVDISETKEVGRGFGSDIVRYGFIGNGSEADEFDGRQNGAGNKYRGFIDDLRLYHRTLSDAEVASLYNSAVTDTDADGLSDLEESHLGTFANLADSDGDGLLDGEEVRGFHSYEYREGNFTWLEARVDADSRGGHLATITSAEENAYAYSAMPGSFNAWLGGIDADFDGNFTWITDEVWEYENWEAGQPNNGSPGRLLTYWNGSGDTWHDGQFNESSGYLLERVFHSDPLKPDTDGDGLLDGEEAKGLEYRSNPMLVDTDGDGRSDREEIVGIKSYELIDATYTWEQARDDAQLRGGHLATITSQREQDLITSLVGSNNAWLGGTDEDLDGTWEWITGEPWTYENMGPGQPDNTDGNSTKLNLWSLYPGKWADNRNANLQSYVLERMIKGDPSRAEAESPLLPSDQRLDWRETDPFPIAQFLYDGVDVIDGRIYVAGGSDGGYSDQFSRYDPETGQWESLPPMSMPRRFMSSAVVDGKFYAIGGKSDSSTDLNSTEIYDPTTNTWTPGPSLPRASWSANSVSLNGKIFLTGGEGSSNLDEMLEFDPTTGQWAAKASLQTGRSSHSGVAWNGKIYLAGGWESATGNLATVTVYDPDLDVWTDLPPMNRIRKWPSLFVVGDRLYVAVGVQNGESLRLSSIEVYDPDANEWIMAGDLPEAKYCAGSAVVNGKVYLFAGMNETAMNNKMFVGEPNSVVLVQNESPNLDIHANRIYQPKSSAENNASVHQFSVFDADANDTLRYYLPPATVSQITIEAENFSWGNVTRGNSSIGTQASMGGQVNDAVYDINVSHSGLWKLEVLRAAFEDRPCKIYINGILLSNDGAGGTTGGWNHEDQQWKDEGIFSFRAGVNEIRLERFGYFPHIDKIRLTPQFAAATDQEKFMIDEQTGVLSLIAEPDYEIPHDTNGDNIYEVDVVATNGESSVSQRLYLEITDNPEADIVVTGGVEVTHEAGDTYNDAGAYWTHTLDGNGTIEANGSVDEGVPGEYVLSYQLTDSLGKSYLLSRQVNVVDTTPPVITLNGDANITIEAGSAYVDAGAKWTDIVDGNGTLTGVGQVNTLVPGEYQVVFNYSDQAGNQANSVIRIVNVIDTTPPVITLDGNASIIHPVWVNFVEPGYQAHDLVDGNLTAEVLVTGNVNHAQPGDYTLSYDVADRAGNQATVITRTIKVVNRAPIDILLSNHTVSENEPVGSRIGTFSTNDPDDAEGVKSYHYELLDGNYSSGNIPFRIDENGTLRTDRSLDWEDWKSHEIRVRSSDEFGGAFEKSFVISVTDLFRPIVITAESYELKDEKYVLTGEVLDHGGHASIKESGMLVSHHPEPTMGDQGMIVLKSGNVQMAKFSVTFEGAATMPENFYFRAYASNDEGISYGASILIRKPPTLGLPAKLGGQEMAGANGWWESPWFGTFYYTMPNGWLMHEDLGWVYTFPSSSGGFWLWMENLNWMWSRRDLYPFLYSNQKASWIFFYGKVEDELLFYDYRENLWLRPRRPKEL